MAAYGEYIDVRIRTFKDLKHDLVRVQTESNRRSDGLGAGCKLIESRWKVRSLQYSKSKASEALGR